MSLDYEAYEILREAILTGQLPQGQRVNEVQASRELGISRGPLREALRRLEQDGLVKSYPNRGVEIIRPTARDALNLLNVRRLLEPYAVIEAFKRQPAELRVAARQALNEIYLAAKSGDPTNDSAAHSRFHALFYSRAGNDHLDRIWTRLEGPVSLYLQLRPSSIPELVTVASAHDRLVELLETGDTSAIRAEVLAHLDVSLRSLRRLVSNRSSAAPGPELVDA